MVLITVSAQFKSICLRDNLWEVPNCHEETSSYVSLLIADLWKSHFGLGEWTDTVIAREVHTQTVCGGSKEPGHVA